MDPTQALKEIRQLLKQLDDVDASEHPVHGHVIEALCIRVQGLDEWLTNGGFLPEPWEKTREHGETVRINALKNIQSLSADFGIVRGDSEIHRIATEALAALRKPTKVPEPPVQPYQVDPLDTPNSRVELKLVLDHVDYIGGACRVNETVGGALPVTILQRARKSVGYE